VSDPFGTSEPAVPTNTTANNFTPIKALSTFCRDWIICARVASKSELRNTKAGGKLLKLELVDKHNTHIEATFFNESAVTFFPQIEENRVYLFSNGYVKMANKKFTSVRNDYSITFDTRSLIEPASDDGAISRHSFDFMPIDQMKEVFQKKTLDVVGIVINVEEKESIKLKSGDQKARKFLEIVDDSMASIGVTCWGDNLCD
jgi:replication factor A1